MAKIRVGQLAKELNLKVPEVLARLRELGAEAKTNLSTVEDEVAGRLRASIPAAGQKPAEGAAARTGAGRRSAAPTAASGATAPRAVSKPQTVSRPATPHAAVPAAARPP